jgi:IstB-like ATP binding protein
VTVPTGLGKTHLSVAVGLALLKRGYTVRFTTVQALLTRVLRAPSLDGRARVREGVVHDHDSQISEVSYLIPRDNYRRFGPSAICHSLQFFGIASAFDSDLRGSCIDVAEIAGREFDSRRSDVLLHSRQFRRTGNGNNPRLLSE